MSIQICGAPCCWGVDDPKNPYLPSWTRVLEEAGKAGYSAIELGPYGYLPIDAELVANELRKNGLAIVAGTIFHDLLDADNQESVLHAVDDICRLITDPKLPVLKTHDGQKFPTPYMTVMDWGHDERDYAAGHRACRMRNGRDSWATSALYASAQTNGAFVRLSIRMQAATSSLQTRLQRLSAIFRTRLPVCVWIPVTCTIRTWTRWSTSKSTLTSWITSTSRT